MTKYNKLGTKYVIPSGVFGVEESLLNRNK